MLMLAANNQNSVILENVFGLDVSLNQDSNNLLDISILPQNQIDKLENIKEP